jgi:predicted NBD/HSP70 family sugar kinase
VRGLIAGAREGEPIATALVHRAGRALGVAFANLLNLVNPARLIVGGPLAEAGPLLLEPAREVLAARALWSSVEDSALVLGALGDRAVALGGATWLLQALLDDPGDLRTPSALSPRQRADGAWLTSPV